MSQSVLRLSVCLTALAGASAAQDATRVRADNPPRWGANVRLERVAAVGTLDGPPEYALGRIGYLATLPDGSFFVYDDKEIQIRLYDRAGKFVSKVGMKGDGPGEYRQLMGMDVVGDSQLVTWDVGNARISYFSRAGKYVSSVKLLRSGSSYGDKMFGVDAKGRIYLQTPVFTRRGEPPTVRYLVYSPKGDPVDSIPVVQDDGGGGGFVLSTPDGDRHNFPIKTITSLYPPGGVIEARTDRYAITVRTSVSGTPMVIERRHQPVPLRAEERGEWEEITGEFAKPRPVRPGAQPRPPFEPRPLPQMKPALREVYGDVDGRIWAEVYVAAEKQAKDPSTNVNRRLTWRERTTFDVFGRDGGFLGRVQLPLAATLLSARGNQIWVGTVGDSDEPMIVSYELVGVGLQSER